MGASPLVTIASVVASVLAFALIDPKLAGVNAFVPPQSTITFTSTPVNPARIAPPSPIIEEQLQQRAAGNRNFALSVNGRIRFSESNEASRKYRRTVYSYADWPIHRSPNRFRVGVQTFFASQILRGLWKQVYFIGYVAAFVVIWNGLTGGFVDFGGVQRAPLLRGLPMLALPMELFNLTSSSLGLLLGT